MHHNRKSSLLQRYKLTRLWRVSCGRSTPIQILLLLPLLSACGTVANVLKDTPVACEGLTTFNQSADEMNICSGKEIESLSIERKPDGSFTLEATGIEAFDGQALRAETDARNAENIGLLIEKIPAAGP